VGIEGILRGKFEFRGGRVSGWVEDNLGPPKGPLELSITRHGQPIASYELRKKRTERNFRFVFDAGNSFTGAEILREDVKILVRNTRGDTGRLPIEGVNALEFIRETLGAPVDIAFDLSFAHGGNARQFLRDGWSYQEQNFIWMVDTESFISVPAPGTIGKYFLRLSLAPLIHERRAEIQNLDIYINERLVGAYCCRTTGNQFLEYPVDLGVIRLSPQLSMRLYHPDAVRPFDIVGGRDKRLLSFAAIRITLVRVLGERPA
jgi:hypothetical protein